MDHLKLFIQFAAKELGIKTLPKIHFVGNKENKMHAFGHTNKKDIYVRVTDRHPLDIMRTLAHELIHCRQKSGGDSWKEDNANEMAGRLMRKFDNKYPNIFKDKAIKANMMEDGEGGMTTSALAVNHTGPGISNFDPMLKFKAKPLKRKILSGGLDNVFGKTSTKYNHKLPEGVPKSLRDILGRDSRNEKKQDRK